MKSASCRDILWLPSICLELTLDEHTTGRWHSQQKENPTIDEIYEIYEPHGT